MTTVLAALSIAAATTVATTAPAPRTIPVEFTSAGTTLRGTLFLPGDAPTGARLPAVVVTGAWFTVKEQMASTYAAQMAQRGMAALAFDFRGWGTSDGAIRQREVPSEKIADIIAAAAFLATRPEVDAGRIGGLGICASAGYMSAAAAQSAVLKSVALVAPWLHDAAIVEAVYGGRSGVDALITAGRTAKAAAEASGTQTFLPAASTTDKSALMGGIPYYTEIDRGMIREWRNEVDPAFWEGWLTFDAQQYAVRLTQPFLMVHSEAAAIPQGAKQFFGTVTAPKQQLWLDRVTQFGFYDLAVPVTAASNAVAAHFTSTMR